MSVEFSILGTRYLLCLYNKNIHRWKLYSILFSWFYWNILSSTRFSIKGHFSICLQFVKHLMFQRKQIPSSIDAIRKDVETKPSTAAAPDPQTTTGGSASLRGGPASVQEKLRRKRLADKQSRTKEKYLTRAKTFLDSYQALEDDICRHLDQVRI